MLRFGLLTPRESESWIVGLRPRSERQLWAGFFLIPFFIAVLIWSIPFWYSLVNTFLVWGCIQYHFGAYPLHGQSQKVGLLLEMRAVRV